MLAARDARFDGRFFTGVTSTRIYCRPICSARTPRPDNCRFYRTAAAAEQAGFRPCLRCRPELAPGTASVDAATRLAECAAAAIEEGALEAQGLTGLAHQLGVTDRHLRRVFAAQFGVSPIEYAQTQRLLLAKRLLTDTALPITEVAMAAGFSSLRRFNDCFVRRYRLAPSGLRAASGGADAAVSGDAVSSRDGGLRFHLAFRPPLDWPALLDFLGHRMIAGVEQVEPAEGPSGGVYRRVVTLKDRRGALRRGWIEVSRPADRRRAANVLRLTLDAALVGAIPPALGAVRRAFDLGCRPDEVAAVLGPLAHGHEGVRLPGAFDGFEIAVRAIAGQQVTVVQARAIVGRIVQAWGAPVPSPWPAVQRAFPGATQLAACDPDELRACGLLPSRARTLVALAQAVADGSVRLAPDADPQATLAQLTALPGIGDWTAQYIAMRALGWPDAFPAADAVLMKALGVRTAPQARAAAQVWRPWRGYAVVHLWRQAAAARTRPVEPAPSTPLQGDRDGLRDPAE